ncbi:hypothetical protein F5Y19DRAFT_435704 [Xylariaceae sp. FL1651]|nr:hypothetical protein F5Y19DRAFT_435704 [Xylariaceae sp. FL1651]
MSRYCYEAIMPSSNSQDLHLAHPTTDECRRISINTFASWGDSLELADYLKESLFLSTIPLAKDSGQTNWILVDKNLAAEQRDILCSCESFKKRALVSDTGGRVEERLIHGIASVFCPPEYRGQGYAARHMRELAVRLRDWQSDQAPVIASVLYSDIGKIFYARLGWTPNPTNMHIEFAPQRILNSSISARKILEHDLAALCERDEAMIQAAMTTASPGMQKRVVILPDIDHMLWHIRKEDFATKHLFGTTPLAKGAIAGPPGKQVWAIWTHRYYGRPDAASPSNVLYILRLVIEGDDSANKQTSIGPMNPDHRLPEGQAAHLEAVLRAAQNEAAEWQLNCVKLWEPSPWAHKAIASSLIDHTVVEREEDSIASIMWYIDDGHVKTPPVFINNEHYAWL